MTTDHDLGVRILSGAPHKECNDNMDSQFKRNNANFVHVQLAGANKFEPDKMDRVVNQPVEEWNLC